MKTATIMYIPEEIEDGSEFERLDNMFPQAANHDGVNKVFPLVLDDAVNPIIVNDMVNEEGDKLAGDELLAAVASVLFADDRTPPIQISYGDLQALFEHPIYQLYAGNFETLEDLKALYLATIGTELVASTLDIGKTKAREAVKNYFA